MSQRQLTFLFLTVRGVMSIKIHYKPTRKFNAACALHKQSTHVVTRSC